MDFEQEFQELYGGSYKAVKHGLRRYKNWGLPRLQSEFDRLSGFAGTPMASRSQHDIKALKKVIEIRSRPVPDATASESGPFDPFSFLPAYQQFGQQQQQQGVNPMQSIPSGPAYFGIGGVSRSQPNMKSQNVNLWGGVAGQSNQGYNAQLGPMMNQAYGRSPGYMGIRTQTGMQ